MHILNDVQTFKITIKILLIIDYTRMTNFGDLKQCIVLTILISVRVLSFLCRSECKVFLVVILHTYRINY